jgi:hypothetical protein
MIVSERSGEAGAENDDGRAPEIDARPASTRQAELEATGGRNWARGIIDAALVTGAWLARPSGMGQGCWSA